jgi:hypothetical protein
LGYQADLGGLHLKVEVRDDGWQYTVIRVKGNMVLKDWTISPHASTTEYSEPENTKFQAVSWALMELGRTQENPHEMFRQINWTAYYSPPPPVKR